MQRSKLNLFGRNTGESGPSIPSIAIHRGGIDLIDVAKMLSKKSVTILISIIDVREYQFSTSMSTLAFIKFLKNICQPNGYKIRSYWYVNLDFPGY